MIGSPRLASLIRGLAEESFGPETLPTIASASGTLIPVAILRANRP
jgi:hypothetical protein